MKTPIIIAVLIIVAITPVLAVNQQAITPQQMRDYTLVGLLDQISYTHVNTTVDYESIYFTFNVTSFNRSGNTFYRSWELRNFTLPTWQVVYCLNHETAQMCIDSLLERTSPFDYYIDADNLNQWVTIEPVAYQAQNDLYQKELLRALTVREAARAYLYSQANPSIITQLRNYRI